MGFAGVVNAQRGHWSIGLRIAVCPACPVHNISFCACLFMIYYRDSFSTFQRQTLLLFVCFSFPLSMWSGGQYVPVFTFLVGGIGIPCGERIDGLWVSAWVCTDSDLMDTAVHNVVYRGNEHCGHISLVFSLSPCHTQSVVLYYPRVSTFTSSQQAKTECLEVKARIDFRWLASHGEVESLFNVYSHGHLLIQILFSF